MRVFHELKFYFLLKESVEVYLSSGIQPKFFIQSILCVRSECEIQKPNKKESRLVFKVSVPSKDREVYVCVYFFLFFVLVDFLNPY